MILGRLLLASLFFGGCGAWAQAADPVVFEVASVKPLPGNSWRMDIDITGETVSASGTLHHLVELAYGVKEFQVAGGPAWVGSHDAMFQIVAKAGYTAPREVE